MLYAIFSATITACGGNGENTSSSSAFSNSSEHSSASSAAPPDPATIENGQYLIYARASGLVMDIADESTANGANVTQWDYTGGLNQQFEITALNNGYHAIMPLHSAKSLDVWERSTASGGEIRQYDYLGEPHQQWKIEDAGNGYVSITSRHSSHALTVWNDSSQPGGDIRQQTYQNLENQHWRLEPVPDAKEYTLVWSEEFDYQGLPDTSYWSYEQGLVRNNEQQYYTVARPENVNVANGMLTITAQQENYQGAEYTAASLHTRGKVSWTYGRFEIRARIDTRSGMWPAFWMLGNGKWPENGEIDIMEYYQGKILANVAWKANDGNEWSAAWDSSTRSLTNLRHQDPDWQNNFHTWRMDWDENFIRLYVDDVLMNVTNLNNTINPDGSNPFRGKPLYILINLAIGGDNGGNPASTTFPGKYEIDYIRVYQ